jgi:hypothetical protein
MKFSLLQSVKSVKSFCPAAHKYRVKIETQKKIVALSSEKQKQSEQLHPTSPYPGGFNPSEHIKALLSDDTLPRNEH